MKRTEQRRRTVAEILSLAFSSLIVLALVVLVVFKRYTTSNKPPVLKARILDAGSGLRANQHYIRVEVINEGEVAAEAVQVEVKNHAQTSQFEIDFLDAKEKSVGVVILDPTSTYDSLSVRVVSYREP
jgi:uncharacterized protein (TIGR02588 family)